VDPHYYSDRSGEINFVFQNGTEGIPAEAKSCEAKSAPTFKKYVNAPLPKHAVIFSKRGYRNDGYITNMPMYLARKMKDFL